MPTYEYRCSDCGFLFETFQRIDEEPLTVCERCGGRLRKVFHPAGIVFRGSGFYATDSRSKSKAGSNESADRKAEKAEKSEKKETKEKKPAEKGDTKESSGSESSP
ncbi:MAG: FmdB family zinc ribbon protein [Actinomycetota bacterium]